MYEKIPKSMEIRLYVLHLHLGCYFVILMYIAILDSFLQARPFANLSTTIFL